MLVARRLGVVVTARNLIGPAKMRADEEDQGHEEGDDASHARTRNLCEQPTLQLRIFLGWVKRSYGLGVEKGRERPRLRVPGLPGLQADRPPAKFLIFLGQEHRRLRAVGLSDDPEQTTVVSPFSCRSDSGISPQSSVTCRNKAVPMSSLLSVADARGVQTTWPSGKSSTLGLLPLPLSTA